MQAQWQLRSLSMDYLVMVGVERAKRRLHAITAGHATKPKFGSGQERITWLLQHSVIAIMV
jgi:hypothetical protein